MKKCPNCDEYCSYEDEMKGKCSGCGYRLKEDGEPIPPPTYSEHAAPPDGYHHVKEKTDMNGTLSMTSDLLKNNLTAIFVFLLIPIIIVSTINIYSAWVLTSSLEELGIGDTDEENIGELFDFFATLILVVLPLSLVVMMIEFLFAGGLVGMAKEGFEGRPMEISTGFNVIKKHPVGVIGASMVLTLLLTLGIALCLIPALIFCYWWLFTIPILVIEGKGIFESMSSSKQFAKEHDTLGFTIALMILVIVVNIVGSFISGMLSGTMLYSFDYTSTDAIIFGPQIVISQIIGSIFSVLVTAIAIMCVSVHYMRGRMSRSQNIPWQKPPYNPPPYNYGR